jgi:hypothetical protein
MAALYTHPTDADQDAATDALKKPFSIRLLTRPLKSASAALPESSIFWLFAGLFKWRDPDSNRGHHDFQSYSEAFRYAENAHR